MNIKGGLQAGSPVEIDHPITVDGFSFTSLRVRMGTKNIGYEGVRNCIKCYVSRQTKKDGI